MLIIRIFTLLLFMASAQTALAQETLPDSFADANALGEYLESRIETYFSAIEVVKSDERIIEAMEAWNGDKLESLEKSLQTKLPDSLRVRLYPEGLEKADYNNSPACGYACIETVRAAYQAPPRAEALLYKTPDASLTLVRAIYKGNEAVGTIVVHYPYSIIPQAINKLSQGTGLYVEFHQSYTNKSNTLTSHGDNQLKQGSAQQTAQITGTRWSINAWKPDGITIGDYEITSPGVPDLPWIYIGIGLFVLIVGIVLMVGYTKHRRNNPPPPEPGDLPSMGEHEEGKTTSRTVVLGGGASDVDVSKYLKEDDITDLKNRLDD